MTPTFLLCKPERPQSHLPTTQEDSQRVYVPPMQQQRNMEQAPECPEHGRRGWRGR